MTEQTVTLTYELSMQAWAYPEEGMSLDGLVAHLRAVGNHILAIDEDAQCVLIGFFHGEPPAMGNVSIDTPTTISSRAYVAAVSERLLRGGGLCGDGTLHQPDEAN